MQEKNAFERIFFTTPTALPYYSRRHVLRPILLSVSWFAPLPRAAPVSQFCPSSPWQPTGYCFRIQHSPADLRGLW
jgi:hypothetical protein